MEGKSITFGSTGLDLLAFALGATGQPQDLVWLTERYLEILRELVHAEEPTT
jgi:hypothetical protein